MLNDILKGGAPEPADAAPHRAPLVELGCTTCGQRFTAPAPAPRCPTCERAADVALMRAMDADARRSRRNNLVIGLALIALGAGVTVLTYSRGSVWMIGVGPIVLGLSGLFRALVA